MVATSARPFDYSKSRKTRDGNFIKMRMPNNFQLSNAQQGISRTFPICTGNGRAAVKLGREKAHDSGSKKGE